MFTNDLKEKMAEKSKHVAIKVATHYTNLAYPFLLISRR